MAVGDSDGSSRKPPVAPLSSPRFAWRDAVPCGLLQTQANGTILSANATFCTWIVQPAEALIGRRLQDLFTIGGRIFHQTHWGPLMQMQGAVTELKLDILRPDGTTLPMVFNASRQEYDGQVVHEIAAFVARERDRYERELLRSRTLLEDHVTNAQQVQASAMDRAQFAEQMVGIVSHDLRNPLSSVGMAAALVARDPLTPRQSRALERIRHSLKRATELTGDLLDFTRARVGNGLPVKPQRINLHDAVGHAIAELSGAHPQQKIEHVKAGDGACTADANRLTQLTGNLMSNALVYAKANTPITITSAVDTTTCTISVHNQGTAIPQASQAMLFEPMTRGPGAEKHASPRSVGLGLFIVREIARAHRGDARVVSTPEGGTTFLVNFPRPTAP